MVNALEQPLGRIREGALGDHLNASLRRRRQNCTAQVTYLLRAQKCWGGDQPLILNSRALPETSYISYTVILLHMIFLNHEESKSHVADF